MQTVPYLQRTSQYREWHDTEIGLIERQLSLYFDTPLSGFNLCRYFEDFRHAMQCDGDDQLRLICGNTDNMYQREGIRIRFKNFSQHVAACA